jgi:predicted dehydrogenase
MMAKREIAFGVIGCGLMGREFASAVGRWRHLLDLDFEPSIIAACNTSDHGLDWFRRNIPTLKLATHDYHALLDHPEVEAVYIAVPHNLHKQIYVDAIQAGKHLLGEKPFGIDQAANETILTACQESPKLLVRCASQFPYFPGAYQVAQWMRQKRFGNIIEVQAGFLHSSDLNPEKPINWKRQVALNGEYGCMGDLGMHVLYLPLRFGWDPVSVSAFLSKIISERPDSSGKHVPCETWDNAVLGCEVLTAEQKFPMFLSFKRIAPGHANSWYIHVYGTEFSVEFSTKNPQQLAYLPYKPGGAQEWHLIDVPYKSAYPTITGAIFEFGFSDAILQMWAAFCDELVHGSGGMTQFLYCATPQETAFSHRLFTAALYSQKSGNTIRFDNPEWEI